MAEGTKRIKVVLFSGGRGGASIAQVLDRHPQVELTVLVNAYDDGLSTGRLRRYVPGMLGPSDIRKNIWNLIQEGDHSLKALSHLLEFRLPLGTDRKTGRDSLLLLCGEAAKLAVEAVGEYYADLTISQTKTITKWARSFLDYENDCDAAGKAFDYGDTSVGNLLFTGCYLIENSDFNRAIASFASFCKLRSQVLNITDGSNRVLTALKEDGSYLADEAAIVSPQDDTPIQEIFLLKDYLDPEEMDTLQGLSPEDRKAYLRKQERLPESNPEALTEIRDADLVIFGPGTQHSSLFPSYVTQELTEALLGNHDAEKVFVANIYHDHDIPNSSVHHLLENLCFYLSRKGEVKLGLSQVVSRLFVQVPDLTRLDNKQGLNYLPFDPQSIPFPEIAVTAVNWEEKTGYHSGGRIVDELMRITQHLVGVRLKPYRHLISIVVPVLNEFKTLDRVLSSLQLLDLSPLKVNKEVIVVDGGSDDGSLERLQKEPFIHLHQLAVGQQGRGAAIRLGMEMAHGNIIVVFPSDDEYDSQDILRVAAPIMTNDFQIVFGSRAIRSDDINSTLREIYGQNYIRRLISKYGGLLTSLACLFLYKRFIGDPFTTLKAIDADLLRQIRLTANGFDFETELIAKARLAGQFILEVPVWYQPRQRSAGKKTTIPSGLKALFRLIKHRFDGTSKSLQSN